MKKVVSQNNQLVCASAGLEAYSKREEGQLAVIKKNRTPIRLKLLLNAYVSSSNESGALRPGTGVYIRPDRTNHTWAKERFVMDIDGENVEFVLVPFNEVVLIEKEDDE